MATTTRDRGTGPTPQRAPDTRRPGGSRAEAGHESGGRAGGSLVISEKVLEKIAAQSASELPFVSGFGGGVLGIGRSVGAQHRPSASVHLSGSSVTVFLDVALGFPENLEARSADIRRHLTQAIERSTGLAVRRIDITVKALTTGSDHQKRNLL